MTREHHVIGRAPDWARKHHKFRHLDGSDASWRSVMRETEESRDWAEAFAFLCGSGITLMLVFAALVLMGWQP